MLIVAQKLSLGWTTRASAVAYFDGALCELAAIPPNAFPLLAIGSLLIAAKMEEEEINVPTVSSLLQVRSSHRRALFLGSDMNFCSQAAESTATMQELNVMELLILKVWRWNVCVVTAAHFIPFYARVARVYDTVAPDPSEDVCQAIQLRARICTPSDSLSCEQIMQPEEGSVDVVLTDPITRLALSIAEGAALDATAMACVSSCLR